MGEARRDALLWIGGALLIVAGLVLWLWWSQPADNTLPSQYGFGIL